MARLRKRVSEVKMIQVLARIALREHAPDCATTFCPIYECVCYKPDTWASEALGFPPACHQTKSQQKALRVLKEGL